MKLFSLALFIAAAMALVSCEGETKSSTVQDSEKSVMSRSQHSLDNFAVAGTKMFFTDAADFSDAALWVSDGTTAGSKILKNFDLWEYQSNCLSVFLVPVGTKVFFAAYDSASGCELWSSDGTTANTKIVKNITENGNSAIRAVGAVNGYFIFTRTLVNDQTGINSYELWKSNGTDAGTEKITDLGEYEIKAFAANSTYFYYVTDSADGLKLLKRSSTTNAASEITSFSADESVKLTAADDLLYISVTSEAGDSLYSYDYLTSAVKTISLFNSNSLRPIMKAGTLFYFFANGTLWTTSKGTTQPTLTNTTVQFNYTESYPEFRYAVMNKTLYFAVSGSLWKSNGTTVGTTKISDGLSAVNGFYNIASTNATSSGYVLFVRGDNKELMKTTGSTPTTVKMDYNGGSMTNLTSIGTNVYYTDYSITDSERLWKSANGAAPTIVKNLRPANAMPEKITNLNGTVYFTANTESTGTELYKSTGTSTGTVLVKDHTTSPNASVSSTFTDFANIGTTYYFGINNKAMKLTGTTWTTLGTMSFYNPLVNGSALYFTSGRAFDFEKDKALYKTSGGAPTLVKNFSEIGKPVFFNGKLYFAAADIAGTYGSELWVSDGTAAGTVMVKDINSGADGSKPMSFYTVGGKLFFSADNGANGRELWVTDGTSSGTTMVKDINQSGSGLGEENSFRFAAVLNGKLYFAATDPVNGIELWSSDGTYEGTNLVIDLIPGSMSGNPIQFLLHGSDIYFLANSIDPDNSEQSTLQLFKTNGTAEGTTLVTNISGAYIENFISSGGKLYFVADMMNGNGIELYTANGNENGHLLVKDIFPGAGSSSVYGLTDVNGILYFSANNGVNGSELWKSNGTTSGTVMVKDISY